MLFSRNIPPSCSYCRYGGSIGDGEVACSKRGIVLADNFCKKFRYDPIKRSPEAPLPHPGVALPEGSSNDRTEFTL